MPSLRLMYCVKQAVRWKVLATVCCRRRANYVQASLDAAALHGGAVL